MSSSSSSSSSAPAAAPILRKFVQVDVFGARAYGGNPLAVVVNGQGLSTEQMQQFARWTNLSETTFLLPPSNPAADYRVRIFTPTMELPFAGHPTLGSCFAWLTQAGGVPRDPSGERIVQECGVGLVALRTLSGTNGGEGGAAVVEQGSAAVIEAGAGSAGGSLTLAFAAPPLVREGPVSAETRAKVEAQLQCPPADILDVVWADNGPGWVAVQMRSVRALLALKPVAGEYFIGAVAIYGGEGGGGRGEGEKVVGVQEGEKKEKGGETQEGEPAAPQGCAIEVRAFFTSAHGYVEDPVTGSLNASLAQWLLRSGKMHAPYVASQGTVLGCEGRVHVEEGEGDVWIGGKTVGCIVGQVCL